MAGKLLTIGYEKREQGEYLTMLREAGVTLLADVRHNPRSRKKGFSKTALREGCEAAGIRYEHLPALGIPSSQRKDVKTAADYEALFARYAEERLPQEGETLAKLKGWVDQGERVALGCYERDASHCHRHYIVQALGMDATDL